MARCQLDPDPLIDEILAGRESLWEVFVAAIHPMILEICRKRSRRRVDSDRDSHREVAVLVIERLRHDHYRALGHYVRARANYPEASFDRWLATVVANSYVDYLRSTAEVQRLRVVGGRALARIEVVSLDAVAPPAATTPDAATVIEVHRILDDLAATAFPELQRRAIIAWLRGANADEIADELELETSSEAKKLLHAARERLRRTTRERIGHGH